MFSVMISIQHQCIFVEVPKTGSTSIRRILGSPNVPHLSCWEIRRLMLSELDDAKKASIGRGFYRLLPQVTRRRLGGERFDSFYKFGFVRNPWDRVVSLYMRNEGIQSRHDQTFEQFVRKLRYSSATCIHPSPQVNQLDWFIDPSGNVIADYIGKFETLDQDWAIIRQKLRGDLPETLSRAKANPHKVRHYSLYYTDETRSIVADRFRLDIEYFDYQFESC